jgi:hypothetical protein
MSKEKETAEATAEAKSPFMYIEGTPMAIHANMKFGDFRPFGDKEQAFTKFKMHLVGWRFFKSKMYVKTTDDEKNINELIAKDGKTKEEAFLENQKKQTKDWAELYFFKDFDPKKKNPLCVMLIKTYSLANFVNEIRKFFYATIEENEQERLCQMTDLVFDVSVKEATNQKGQFFCIEFKAVLADKAVVKEVSKFSEEGHKIYDSQNITENIRNADTYKPLPNTKGWELPTNIEKRAFLLGEKENLVLNEQN